MAIPSQAQVTNLFTAFYGYAPDEGDLYTFTDSEHYIEYKYENTVWSPQRLQQVFENNILPVVNTYNGLSGSVQGVSAVYAGNGISISGNTGAVTIAVDFVDGGFL